MGRKVLQFIYVLNNDCKENEEEIQNMHTEIQCSQEIVNIHQDDMISHSNPAIIIN